MIEINEETEEQHRKDLAELADNIQHSKESNSLLVQANYAKIAMALIPRIMAHQEARFAYLFAQLQKIDKKFGGGRE